jgi:hypothetical protein
MLNRVNTDPVRVEVRHELVVDHRLEVHEPRRHRVPVLLRSCSVMFENVA